MTNNITYENLTFEFETNN